jgi:hypothetical protein
MLLVLRLVLVLAVAALAAAATPAKSAKAGLLTCMDKVEYPFAPWGDLSKYTLAPNGSLELGSTGWSLAGGARVVAQNNSLRAGKYSLSLPAGASATSPAACVKVADPASRFFLRNAGVSTGKLKVELEYRTLLGLLPFRATLGYVTADGTWQPSPKYGHLIANILGTLNLNKNLSASLRFKFTSVGSGSSFQVDDLFVDPLLQV